MRHPDNGEKVKRGKATRWMCVMCINKVNKSIYAGKQNVAATTDTSRSNH